MCHHSNAPSLPWPEAQDPEFANFARPACCTLLCYCSSVANTAFLGMSRSPVMMPGPTQVTTGARVCLLFWTDTSWLPEGELGVASRESDAPKLETLGSASGCLCRFGALLQKVNPPGSKEPCLSPQGTTLLCRSLGQRRHGSHPGKPFLKPHPAHLSSQACKCHVDFWNISEHKPPLLLL